MTWPFENDTGAIVRKLAEKSLKGERRRNFMVAAAVALAAALISFAGLVSASLIQMQRSRVADTYEAVYNGVTEQDVKKLKELPELARVGEYYLAGTEHSQQGYHGSYAYCDGEMLYTGREQMRLIKGRLPEKENEIAVSQSWLSRYAPDTQIGGTVLLDTESFGGSYVISGLTDALTDEKSGTYPFLISKDAIKAWENYDPAGYRAYAHFQNDRELDEETMTAYCRRIAKKLHLPPPGMNSAYFEFYRKPADYTLIAGLAALVLIAGYIVIQSIFRISVIDKIQSYGQLRTIGATQKQIRRIVKREGRRLGSIGILAGIIPGAAGSLVLFPGGFHALLYAAVILLTVFICRFMVSVAIRKPVKIAAGISPVEAMRFVPEQKTVRRRKKTPRLNPVSMGIANFKREPKKTVSIVASLSLGGILFLIVSSAIDTRSPEQYARRLFPDGDYKIYLSSEQSEAEIMAAGNPLNKELKQELLSVDGITEVLLTRQSVHADFGTAANASAGMCDMLTDANYAKAEAALVSGSMPGDSHSIILDRNNYKRFEDMDTGKSLELTLGRKTVSVKISGLFDAKKLPSGHGALTMDGAMLYAPEELFRELLPEIESFDYSWSIVSDPEKARSVKEGLENIVAGHSDIALDEIGGVIEFEEMQNTVLLGGIQGISWLIFLFGAVNLINTTLSNQMSRRRENSIMRSVGLTGKQLCRMNICEGICYAFSASLTTLAAGIPVSIAVCAEISKASFGGEIVPYRFPVLETGLFTAALFGMQMLLSVWVIRRQKKYSLIEQMRGME